MGHSLAGSVALELHKIITKRFKTNFDIISMFDNNALTIHKNSLNPLSLHSYDNYADTGLETGKQIM